MRVAIVLVVVAGCIWGHDSRDTSCIGDHIDVAGRAYCLVTCPGALEDGVWQPGLDILGRFDDGLVMTPQHHGADGVVEPAPKTIPDEVCRALPHGCTCTSLACTYPKRVAPATSTELEGPSPPRCEAGDPQCGPMAFSHECVAPAARRVPVGGPSLQSDPENTCAYDGECVGGGCGYACSSVRGPERVYTCIGIPALDEELATAQCGCVAGQCRWFVPGS